MEGSGQSLPEARPCETTHSKKGSDILLANAQAHVHYQWVPLRALEIDPANKQRAQRYVKALNAAEASGGFVPTWELNKEVEPSEANATSAATEEGQTGPSNLR